MTRLDQASVTSLLRGWAETHIAPSASVTEAWPMPGNAGLSFGFDVLVEAGAVRPGFAPSPVDGRVSLVIRLAPPGVRRSGNTDVLRQVPLLAALHAHHVPVAPVVWSTSDEGWFGTDAVVQERLDALPLHVTDARLSVAPGDGDVSAYVRRAVGALAAIHAVDHATVLPGWETPRSVGDELTHWSRLLGRCGEPAWEGAGNRLAAFLAAHQPRNVRVGLLHGDFQTNNVLFDRAGSLRAVIDWELAGIGPQLLDLGWLAMFCDVDCWAEPYVSQMRVQVSPQRVQEWYEEETGVPVGDFPWYRAFACFRFGSISAFNIRLHRTGKRPDPSWEDRVTSVSRLFGRGLELARTRRRSVEPTSGTRARVSTHTRRAGQGRST